MRKKLLIAAVSVLVPALSVFAVLQLAKTKKDAEFDRMTELTQALIYTAPDGAVLPYRIYVPQNYDPANAYPLVLSLHGSGARGDDNVSQLERPPWKSIVFELLSSENLEKYPCIVLAPQCPKDEYWTTRPDEDNPNNAEALMGLLEQTRNTYAVDAARIYITGTSMGGFGTWGMLRYYPGYFAAAVPVCGGWYLDAPNEPELAALRMKDTPIWVFHGAKDKSVPPERSREMVSLLQKAGANDVRYTEYPKGKHNINGKAYAEPELLAWLFAQTKNMEASLCIARTLSAERA